MYGVTARMLFIGPTTPRLRIAEGVVPWPDRATVGIFPAFGKPALAAGGRSIGFFGGADILQCSVPNVAMRREETLVAVKAGREAMKEKMDKCCN
jgi:hypothetical protein